MCGRSDIVAPDAAILSEHLDTYINKAEGNPAFLVLTFRPKSAIMYSKDFGGRDYGGH